MHDRLASIRPRRCRRGEPPAAATRRARRDQLQCGLGAVGEENATFARLVFPGMNRFNSASTLSSRRTTWDSKSSNCRKGLQFGLDAVVEENVVALVVAPPQGGASIRPRRCRRGERTSPSSAAASWGCFNSASTLSSRRTGRAHVGHSDQNLGFNSASTLSSRRTPATLDYCSDGYFASIRPRRCRRGERVSRRGVSPSCAGFNSASTLSSRRTPALGGRDDHAGPASIRPRRCRRGELPDQPVDVS